MGLKYFLTTLLFVSVVAYFVFIHSDTGGNINYDTNSVSVLSAANKVLYESITSDTAKKITTASLDHIDISDQSITIGWVGDIVPVTVTSFDSFTSFFISLDIMSGNLEGVMSESNKYESKCVKMGTLNCITLKGSPDFATMLKQEGFDVLNIANNHSFDFGTFGFMDTQKALDNVGIEHTGAKGKIALIKTPKGTVAFVGFAQNYQLNSLLSENEITAMISKARKQADIVIAIIHAGGEGSSYLMVPEGSEIYLGENRGDTQKITHTMIDAGADMVLGSGPHVLRGIEIYKEKIIAYSLSNFFASNKLLTRDFLGISGILVVNIEPNRTIRSVKVVPARLNPADGTPKLDQNGAAIRLINYLSRENFAKDGILLDENGVYVMEKTK
jgi:hypothetical protein